MFIGDGRPPRRRGRVARERDPKRLNRSGPLVFRAPRRAGNLPSLAHRRPKDDSPGLDARPSSRKARGVANRESSRRGRSVVSRDGAPPSPPPAPGEGGGGVGGRRRSVPRRASGPGGASRNARVRRGAGVRRTRRFHFDSRPEALPAPVRRAANRRAGAKASAPGRPRTSRADPPRRTRVGGSPPDASAGANEGGNASRRVDRLGIGGRSRPEAGLGHVCVCVCALIGASLRSRSNEADSALLRFADGRAAREDDAAFEVSQIGCAWAIICLANDGCRAASVCLDAPPAVALSELPQEEIYGDTSLGIKITLLGGLVVVTSVDPLDDGRASPAQLCRGLLRAGDAIVAVDGRSLVRRGMDVLAALAPLRVPRDEASGTYAREVRLRLVAGGGRDALRERDERERRRAEDIERRRKLGLERVASDPAADLFGIGALMGVDQHSGVPLFGRMDDHRHRDGHRGEGEGGEEGVGGKDEEDEEDEEEKKEGSAERAGVDAPRLAPASAAAPPSAEAEPLAPPATARPPPRRPSLQSRIARRVLLDRRRARDRAAGGFFALGDSDRVPPPLRPPSPPPPDRPPPGDDRSRRSDDPAVVRARRLAGGARRVALAIESLADAEARDRFGPGDAPEDEDPLEVASRACGAAVASVRTGTTVRRRWHRGGGGGGGVLASQAGGSAAPSVSSDRNVDMSTVVSGESGVEACDHRRLVELAADDEGWRVNVIRRLEAFAEETEKEADASLHRGSSSEEEAQATGFDGLLFGGAAAGLLRKKKQSLALPPGEMTSMLFDLAELLEGSGLPDQIVVGGEGTGPPSSPAKSVSFARVTSLESGGGDATRKATAFLVDEALNIWLKSFRPLPWRQRRALWPSHERDGGAGDGDYSTLMSSRMDDNESLSLVSGTTAATGAASAKKNRRNLRELIEDLELDHETRRETCRLVTFYFTHKFSSSGNGGAALKLSLEAEEEAAALIDEYGSYLDIYKCLVSVGRLHSQRLVDKLVAVARYDCQHKEALKALQKAKVLLFYEPSMLSALFELLPSISAGRCTSGFDFIRLLVYAYPDLRPWCVREASKDSHSPESEDDFYMEYLSSLLHHEDGNDAAKRDGALVKEWCSILRSSIEASSAVAEKCRQDFFHIASRDDPSSLLYHRDLPFLMHVSVAISEFGLALSLANEIVSSGRYCRQKQVLLDILQHLSTITDKAIEGNDGELNSVLLGQVIAFFNVISPCMDGQSYEFDIVAELSALLNKCFAESRNRPDYSPNNVHACVDTISENAPPADCLEVLSRWERSSVESSSLVSALHASLFRGAREGVRSELSGSLLRIRRAREEGRRPIVEDGMVSWNPDGADLAEEEEEDAGDFIWQSVLDGTLSCKVR
ncbi:hypothetical protein ACHAWF_014168 [Thalassiosira exigua]